MTQPADPAHFDPVRWREEQIERYGPLVGGEDLRKFLGFRTAAAFLKARSQGAVGVAIFAVPGRQGMFAMTSEVCAWLIAQRIASEEPVPPTTHD